MKSIIHIDDVNAVEEMAEAMRVAKCEYAKMKCKLGIDEMKVRLSYDGNPRHTLAFFLFNCCGEERLKVLQTRSDFDSYTQEEIFCEKTEEVAANLEDYAVRIISFLRMPD